VKPIPNNLFQLGRIILGSALLAKPDKVSKIWLGNNKSEPALTRGFAVRDIALGAATINAAQGPTNQYRLLLALGVAADLSDCLATAGSRAPKASKLLVTTMAAAATVNGLLLLKESYQQDPSLIP